MSDNNVEKRIEKEIEKAKEIRDEMYKDDRKKGVRCTQNGRIAGLQDALEIVKNKDGQ